MSTEQENLSAAALEYHEWPTPGKIAVVPTKGLTNQRDLALVMTAANAGSGGDSKMIGMFVRGCRSVIPVHASSKRWQSKRRWKNRLCTPLPQVASPTMGCAMCLRWRRNWCWRPVSGVSSSKAYRACG